MDESWRMRMGMDRPSFPAAARKSMDQYATRRSSSATTVEADDFSDVFGGPPRSILTRKFSGDFTRSNSFYDEIFLPPEFGSRVPPSPEAHGRSLPAFRIPASDHRFYGDMFGSVGEFASGGSGGRRSREQSWTSSKAKSKSNSSSMLSSEDVSPLRRAAASAVGDDVALSSFASKLRPLNVSSRYRTGRKQGMPAFAHTSHHSFFEHEHAFSRRVSSPETISLEPNSFRSIKLSTDDMGPSSPASSPVSSVCQEAEKKQRSGNYEMKEEEEEEVEEIEEDEIMSSYVIEIVSDHHNFRDGGGESIDIDEAIAWARERSQRRDEKEEIVKTESDHQGQVSADWSSGTIDGHGTMNSSEEEQNYWRTGEEKEKSEEKMEMELLDEDIRLWSSNKETNIRLLLSTLHHILWPNGGWYAVPLANLKEGSQVKKAYQKARLCLHPDKLQQRGATHPQKYVAEKAFSILQDAWAAYITQEGFLH